MGEFSYELPAFDTFLLTVREYLTLIGEHEVSSLLHGAGCRLSSSGLYSGQGNDHRDCTLFLAVPLKVLFKFTDEIKSKLFEASNQVMPGYAGFDVTDIVISPELVGPQHPEEGLNVAIFEYPDAEILEHDGLRFRSPREIELYEILKKRKVLFFPNPAAVLGLANNRRREPDFLICQRGKWGILELNGNSYHQSAAKDYKRADEFAEYGLTFLRFYDAGDDPEKTVDHFLKRLDEF